MIANNTVKNSGLLVLKLMMNKKSSIYSIVSSAPTGFFKTDIDGSFVYVNQKWCQISGLSLDSAQGDGWLHAVHIDDRAQVFAAWSAAVVDGVPFDMEFRFCTPDGTITWVLGQALADRGPEGTLSGYVGTVTDINHSKKAEETMLISQKVAHLGSWDWDISKNSITWTDELYRIFGYVPQEFQPSYDHFIKVVHPEDRKMIQDGVDQALADPNHDYRIEHRILLPDGSERIVVDQGWVERDADLQPIRMVGTVQDISELRSMEGQLRLIQSVLDQTEEGIFITDADGKIISVNQSLCALFGYTAEEMIGRSPKMFRSEHQDQEFYDKMWDSLHEHGMWNGEIWNRRKDGEVFPVKTTIQAINGYNGDVQHYVCVYNDLTAIKQRDQKLAYSTSHDALTGLPNRGLFLDRLGQAVHRAERENSCIGVAVLDIDLFNKVNDSLGNAHGDELLRMFAKRIEDTIRQDDTVCRLGGDEFSIIHPNTGSAETLAQMTQRLFGVLSKPFELAGQELYFTASVGLTIFPEDGKEPDTLLKNAILAMNRAKDFGRSNFQFFTKSLDDRAVRRLALETEIRNGLKKGQFLLHYQPKVELNSGAIIGMESLVRWSPEKNKLVSPAEFIPVAEETGLIVPLGDWILREACFQNVQWHGFDAKLRMAVNLSARQFREKNLINRIDAALRDSNLQPETLELEITESMVMENVEEVVALLRQIKDRGISIAMDDFGTGYSSLSILKNFPIDTLKIDQSFVRKLSRDSDDAQIVAAIISMSHSLNLKVVAEGVETKEQLEFLTERGCDIIQGYYFSKPLSDGDFTQLLHTHKERLLQGS